MPLRFEDSAQGSRARPNSLVLPSLLQCRSLLGQPLDLLIDQGCGRLRHLPLILGQAASLRLVDTRRQLYGKQPIFGVQTSVARYVRDLASQRLSVDVCTDTAFYRCASEADLILSVCVLDAVPTDDRLYIIDAALRNLRPGGYYVVIAPRNNQSVLKRCTASFAMDDGYAWCKGRSCTFYRNFRDHGPLVEILRGFGFELTVDRSSYRYVWLILRKPGAIGEI